MEGDRLAVPLLGGDASVNVADCGSELGGASSVAAVLSRQHAPCLPQPVHCGGRGGPAAGQGCRAAGLKSWKEAEELKSCRAAGLQGCRARRRLQGWKEAAGLQGCKGCKGSWRVQGLQGQPESARAARAARAAGAWKGCKG